MTCFRCQGALPSARARWCSKRCRDAAWRARRLAREVEAASRPMCMRIEDPPYPGRARYYAGEEDYAGEVDHEDLIARAVVDLERGRIDGWALATSSEALSGVLGALASHGYRTDAQREDSHRVWVCPWVKTGGVQPRCRGIDTGHEFVLVVGGRQRPPGVRSWLRAQPARGAVARPGLVGRKPVAWSTWVFALLGADPATDEIEDTYPGSGAISAEWRSLGGRVAPTLVGKED